MEREPILTSTDTASAMATLPPSSKQERVALILSLFDEHERLGRLLRKVNALPENELWPVTVKVTEDWSPHFIITKTMVQRQLTGQLDGVVASITELQREVRALG